MSSRKFATTYRKVDSTNVWGVTVAFARYGASVTFDFGKRYVRFGYEDKS